MKISVIELQPTTHQNWCLWMLMFHNLATKIVYNNNNDFGNVKKTTFIESSTASLNIGSLKRAKTLNKYFLNSQFLDKFSHLESTWKIAKKKFLAIDFRTRYLQLIQAIYSHASELAAKLTHVKIQTWKHKWRYPVKLL